MWVTDDRVRETTTTTGAGDVALAGAVSGFQAFSAACADQDVLFYAIVHKSQAEWEVGYGTYNSGANTLTRTKVLSSSNSDQAVNFSAGTKDVFIDHPALEGQAQINRRTVSGMDVVVPPSSSMYVARNYEITAGRKCQIEAGAVLEIG